MVVVRQNTLKGLLCSWSLFASWLQGFSSHLLLQHCLPELLGAAATWLGKPCKSRDLNAASVYAHHGQQAEAELPNIFRSWRGSSSPPGTALGAVVVLWAHSAAHQTAVFREGESGAAPCCALDLCKQSSLNWQPAPRDEPISGGGETVQPGRKLESQSRGGRSSQALSPRCEP